MKKEIKFDAQFVKDHIHFFLTDLNRLVMKIPGFIHYQDYEKREPHYGKELLTAYSEAFELKLSEGEITP